MKNTPEKKKKRKSKYDEKFKVDFSFGEVLEILSKNIKPDKKVKSTNVKHES